MSGARGTIRSVAICSLVLAALACSPAGGPANVTRTDSAGRTPAGTASGSPVAATASPAGTSTATSVAASAASPTATAVVAPATVVPAATIDVTQVVTSTLASELLSRVRSASPSPTPGAPPNRPAPGIEGVEVLPIGSGADGRPLWAAFSYGVGNIAGGQRHFVAVYGYSTGWQELGRQDLPEINVLGRGSLKRVPLEPSRVWLQVQGGVGAHSGWYSLLSFDGKGLRSEVTHTHSSSDAGCVADLNGDGVQEVVLDETETYVFFYASGVRVRRFKVLRWDGTRLAEVTLAKAAGSAPAGLQGIADQAVTYAKAGLWKDAAGLADQMSAQGSGDEAVKWDVALIRLHAEATAKQAKSGAYPILDNVFYGDYGAAVGIMRTYTPKQIFDPQSPLIMGTSAEKWQKDLVSWAVKSATQAVEAKPDLAAAYFVRGWAENLAEQGSVTARADVQRAADLAPGDRLFGESAGYLQSR